MKLLLIRCFSCMFPLTELVRRRLEKFSEAAVRLLSYCLLCLTLFLPGIAFAKQSVMPLGAFSVDTSQLPLAASLGFEIVHSYEFEENPNIDNKAAVFLDTALKNNLKVFLGFDRGKNYNERRVAERVNRFKNHKALWGWYIADEPGRDMKNKVRLVANLIKRLDPAHPSIIASENPDFIKMADLNFAYTYPVCDKPYPMSNLKSYTQRTKLSNDLGAPFLSLVQVFNWGHFRKDDPKRADYRFPNATEVRFMVYSGIAMGSEGLFFFCFQSVFREVDYRNNVVLPIIKEFKRIRPFLMWNRVTVPSAIRSDGELIYQCWRKGKPVFMIVTNPTATSTEYNIKYNHKRDFGTSISGAGKEMLEPWGVRFYQFETEGE